MFLVHYLVCLYYAVGKLKNSWISRDPSIEEEPVLEQYFLTGTQMSRRSNSYVRGVERDILTQVEKAFDALIFGVYTCCLAWVTSRVTNTMMDLNLRKRERNDRLDYIRNHYFTEHPEVSETVKLQLLKFMRRGFNEMRAAQQRRQSEQLLLRALPIQLAKDFRREAWLPLLSQHKLFKNSDIVLMEDICLKAVDELFCRKHEHIFKLHGQCSRMRFVFKGEFSYDTPYSASMSLSKIRSSKNNESLDLGTQLGEPVLWTSWQHRGSLYALSNGTLCSVLPDELEVVLKSNEALLHDIVIYAQKFVMYLNMKASREMDSLSDICDDVTDSVFNDPEFEEYWID